MDSISSLGAGTAVAPYVPTPAPTPQRSFPLGNITNQPCRTLVLMAGMPLYADKLQAEVLNIMNHRMSSLILVDDAMHRGQLNDPELVIPVDEETGLAHAEYRRLCQALGKPGRYCIRRRDDGEYMLVHRARGGIAPPLKSTPLKCSAAGWQLMVPDGARSAWNALRDRSFPALEVLKANLPRGMQEATDVALQATRL